MPSKKSSYHQPFAGTKKKNLHIAWGELFCCFTVLVITITSRSSEQWKLMGAYGRCDIYAFYNRISTDSSLLFTFKIILNWLVGTKLIFPKLCLQFRSSFEEEIAGKRYKSPAVHTGSLKSLKLPSLLETALLKGFLRHRAVHKHSWALHTSELTGGELHGGGWGDRKGCKPPRASPPLITPTRLFQERAWGISHIFISPQGTLRRKAHTQRASICGLTLKLPVMPQR